MSAQPDNSNIGLCGELVEFPDPLADNLRTLGNARLYDVVRKLEQLLARVRGLAVDRQQPPADQCHINDANHGTGQADRGKVEHPVGRAECVATEFRDDDIRRRPYQRNHSAQDRRERQRHQGQRRATAAFPGRLEVERHQQRESGDVVHDRR